MKRLATLVVLCAPSIALAHPGHEHVGVSPSHHLTSVGALIATLLVGGAAFAAYRFLRKKSND